jgi:hypothetical protein
MNSVTLPTKAEAIAHVKALLLQRLKAGAEAGETVPYSELDALVNDNVRKSYASALKSVRDILLKEYGILFKTKANIGFVPISDEEKLRSVGADSRKKINAETGRWRAKHESISAESLDSQEKIKEYTRECMRLGFQEDINDARHSVKIEAAIEEVAASRQQLEKQKLKSILHAANQAMAGLG